MARIEPFRPRRLAPFVRMTYAESKRQYGKLPAPITAMAHRRGLLAGYGALELAAQHAKRVDERLKALAELKAALVAGCEYCLDIGSFVASRTGVPAEQIRDLPNHRESPHFDDLERLVIDYADAMTRTPVAVSDELVAALREHFDDAQLVELTSAIALENFRARFNWALDLQPQGFADGTACPIPSLANA